MGDRHRNERSRITLARWHPRVRDIMELRGPPDEPYALFGTGYLG
jgi:hypothetical protein